MKWFRFGTTDRMPTSRGSHLGHVNNGDKNLNANVFSNEVGGFYNEKAVQKAAKSEKAYSAGRKTSKFGAPAFALIS